MKYVNGSPSSSSSSPVARLIQEVPARSVNANFSAGAAPHGGRPAGAPDPHPVGSPRQDAHSRDRRWLSTAELQHLLQMTIYTRSAWRKRRSLKEQRRCVSQTLMRSSLPATCSGACGAVPVRPSAASSSSGSPQTGRPRSRAHCEAAAEEPSASSSSSPSCGSLLSLPTTLPIRRERGRRCSACQTRPAAALGVSMRRSCGWNSTNSSRSRTGLASRMSSPCCQKTALAPLRAPRQRLQPAAQQEARQPR